MEQGVAHDGVLYGTVADTVEDFDGRGAGLRPHRLSHDVAAIAARNGVIYVSFRDESVPVVQSRDRGRTAPDQPINERPPAYTSLALFGLKLAKEPIISGDR